MVTPVVSGQWSVVSGQWSVVGGQWSVVGGRWSVVGGRWSVVGGRWSVDLPTTVAELLLHGGADALNVTHAVIVGTEFVGQTDMLEVLFGEGANKIDARPLTGFKGFIIECQVAVEKPRAQILIRFMADEHVTEIIVPRFLAGGCLHERGVVL